jgi:hypothetical protein
VLSISAQNSQLHANRADKNNSKGLELTSILATLAQNRDYTEVRPLGLRALMRGIHLLIIFKMADVHRGIREFEQDNEVRRRRHTRQFLSSAHYLAHTELDVTGGCSACLPVCRCLWILTLILALIQKKNSETWNYISRLCPSAFVQNEVHNEFCQNIRCERRQKNEDGI